MIFYNIAIQAYYNATSFSFIFEKHNVHPDMRNVTGNSFSNLK